MAVRAGLWKFVCASVACVAIGMFAYIVSLRGQGLQLANSGTIESEGGGSTLSEGGGSTLSAAELNPRKVKQIPFSLSKGQEELNYLRSNSISNSLSDVNIDGLNSTQVVLTLHSYLDNHDAICNRKLRLGHLDDGGWEVCDDEWIRPSPPCIIYSFGISNDWTFDDEASRVYGCHVYAFDPSIGLAQHDRSSRIHFYPWGLAGASRTQASGWTMYTLADIREKLGHTDKTIDVVKMDIESSEWPSLPQMVASKQLDTVRQLLAEYHVTGGTNNIQGLKTIQAIERCGFKKFYVHKNFHCGRKQKGFPVMRTSCYEVMYMRSKPTVTLPV